MISQSLMKRIKRDTPELNPDITKGLAVKYVPRSEEYIDSVWKAVAKDFPEGLEYKGCSRCTPYEEFYNEPRKKNDRRMVEIARSDIYMMRYDFRYKGVDLPPRYLFLPFTREAGSITLGGPVYFISPVLSDIILSYEQDNVFVKLLRDRFALKRLNHNVVIDNRMETIPVVWSMIYHVNATQRKATKTAKAECSLFHYLLCRYGFTDTMRRFTDSNPVVLPATAKTKDFPAADWVIVKSSQFKPKTMPARTMYVPSEIRIAVRRSEFNPLVKYMLTAFFYIADHFPTRVLPEYVDNVRLWKVLLGHLIFGSEVSEGKLHDDIDEHIRSLDEYMDSIMQARFKDIGYDIRDIYHFFVVAIENFNDWLLSAKTKANSLYDKELNVLLDLLMPITSSIFTLHFKLKSAAKKGLTEKEIINTFNKYLKPRVIFKLTTQINGVGTMSYSGDNMCMKITANVVPQKSTGGKNKDSQNLDDPTKRLHVSFAEVGSFINLSDSNLTGENKINPSIRLNERGKIIRDPDRKKLLDHVQSLIQRD